MKKLFFETMRPDWTLIIVASIVWVSALLITTWDFVILQRAIYRLSIVNFLGLIFALIGVSLRIIARKTLGKHFIMV